MQPLQDWIAGLSLDAIRTQEIWNKAYLEARESGFLVPSELQKLREFEVSFHSLMETARTRQFEIRCVPLNLNYAIRFQVRTEETSSVRFTVTQHPLSPGVKLPDRTA